VPRTESKPAFALVIPALREAECLRRLLPRAREALARGGVPWEILVVDDDSRDGTEAVVQAAAAAAAEDTARIRLLVRRGQRGLSGAILHGWQHTDAAILGVMDADLQHPPELLPQLLELVRKGADLAIASRYAAGGNSGQWNPFRRLISVAAVRFTRPLDGRSTDPMSGFFVVRRRSIEGIDFQQSGFKLLLEILVRGRIRAVREVPFTFGRRPAGFSKAGLKTAWDYLGLLVRLYRLRRTGQRIAEAASSGD
jgi:dolichol-phosphate mannosyltransferase